jgi:hypothetical protein
MDWLSENDAFLGCRKQELFFGENPGKEDPVNLIAILEISQITTSETQIRVSTFNSENTSD